MQNTKITKLRYDIETLKEGLHFEAVIDNLSRECEILEHIISFMSEKELKESLSFWRLNATKMHRDAYLKMLYRIRDQFLCVDLKKELELREKELKELLNIHTQDIKQKISGKSAKFETIDLSIVELENELETN